MLSCQAPRPITHQRRLLAAFAAASACKAAVNKHNTKQHRPHVLEVNIIICQHTIPWSASGISEAAHQAHLELPAKVTCEITSPHAASALQATGSLLPTAQTAHGQCVYGRCTLFKPAQGPARLVSQSPSPASPSL